MGFEAEATKIVLKTFIKNTALIIYLVPNKSIPIYDLLLNACTCTICEITYNDVEN